jgi:UrcA family protein
MYVRHAVMTARTLLGTAIIACAVAAGNVAAKDHNVTVAIHVSSQGLDLSQPEGARAYYSRIKNAAWVACTRADRVGLEPSDNPQKCVEKSLANAIRAVGLPMLTQIYLESHTLQEAAALGVHTTVSMAAKSQDFPTDRIPTP